MWFAAVLRFTDPLLKHSPVQVWEELPVHLNWRKISLQRMGGLVHNQLSGWGTVTQSLLRCKVLDS